MGGNSGVSGPCKGGCISSSIYNSQGKFHIDYCQNWKDLSKEDHNTVISTHKKRRSKSSQTTNKKGVSDTKRQLSELSSALTEIKSIIATFSGKPQGTSSCDLNSGQEAPVSGKSRN